MNNKYYFIFILGLSFQVAAGEKDIRKNLESCNQSVEAGEYAKAIEFAQQALKEDQNNQEGWLCKGRAHGRAGQLQQAIESIQTAEQRAKTPYERIIALTLLGNAQKNAKQYPDAINSYRKSLAIAEREKMKRIQHINLNLVGDALLDSGEPQAALESYRDGAHKAANDNERADSFERIAAVHLALRQYDPAIEYQIKAQMMQEKSGTLDQYANASLELGRMFTEAGDYQRAEKTLHKIIQFSKDNGGTYYEAKGYFYLSRVKAAMGDKVAAKSLLADAHGLAGTADAPDLAEEISATINQLAN